MSVSNVTKPFVKDFYDRFFDDHCTTISASLAYTTLLTMVPFLAVIFTLLSFIPFFKDVGTQVTDFIVTQFVADSAGMIVNQLQIFLQQLHQLSWLSLLVFSIFSILMFYNVVLSVNRIWHVPMPRYFLLSYLLYAMILLLLPVIFSILFFMGPVLHYLIGSYVTVAFEQIVIVGLHYCLIAAFFTGLNAWVPNARVPFRYALWVGCVTMVVFELAKRGFGYYISMFSTYHVIYGALAVVPIFLVWMYCSWLIIFSGVLACHLLTSRSLCR